ncbi:MAG: DUF748 domain-containing protein [Gammaproteobacteria bacterium]|nr:DUF748 domain-containing protein [Gammaproteobacteria bacterium]
MSDNASRLQRASAAVRQRLWGTPRDWVNPRRKRFWALSILLLYTLAGFLIVPWVARQQIIDRVGELVDRPVALETLRVNPFVLSVEAREFAITEDDGSGILSFERLYVNFQLSSLFRWALTFREITLEHPSLAFVRFADGQTNLGQLLSPAEPEPARTTEAPAEADPEAGLLRVIVGELNLTGGGGTFTDRVPGTDFVQAIGPIDVSIRDISTLPEDSGRQRVAVRIGDEVDVAWQGSLQIEPLQSAGRLTASGAFLPLAYRYFQDQVDVQVPSGTVDLGFDYAVALDDTGTFRADMTELEVDVRDVRVTQAERAIVELPGLRLEGGYLAYPAQRAGARRISLTAPELFMWRDADGISNLERIIRSPPADEPTAEAEPEDDATAAAAWSLSLQRFEVNDLAFDFEDRTLRDPQPIEIRDFDLRLEGLDNAPDTRFPLTLSFNSNTGGRVALNGTMGALPAPFLDAELTVDGLALGIAQPYLNDLALAQIDDGTVSTRTRLTVSAEEPLGASGELTVDGLSIASTQPEERLLGWQQLGVNEFSYSHAAGALEISQVTVSEPYARLLIAEDRTTNFQQLMRQPETAAEPADEGAEPDDGSSDAAPPVQLTIGRVAVSGGSADFSDLSLPLPFRTSISTLEGEMTTLDSSSAEPSQVRLDGQIEDFGLARIQGALMPLGITRNTDVELLFRNVALPDLTPYTIRFAGRRVADGRMEVDLRYQVKDGRMTGQNSVVISDLELGERVEHPDAFDLPLNLAIALLKGPDGRINVDIPVEGDVNDPQFRIGGVIAGAVANVITGIVSSPFRLLARLVGMESEEFGRVKFEPGSAALTPPERQKLSKLGEALNMRPQLALQVNGVVAPQTDRKALQTLATRARIDAALAERSDGEDSAGTMLGDRRRAAIEALFTEDFPETSLAEVRAQFQRPVEEDGEDGEMRLDETAYVAELEQRLIDAAPMDEAQVQALGQERAQRISDWLAENADIDPARITLGETTTTSADSGWIAMELDVTAT